MAKRNLMAGRTAQPQSIKMDDIDVFETMMSQKPEHGVMIEISVENIDPNPYQARKDFNEEALNELALAISKQGFTSVLRVRRHPNNPDRYQLIYGERRLRAARRAGLKKIPCLLVDHTDNEMIEIGLTENILRSDLTDVEQGEAYKRYLDLRDSAGKKIYDIRSLGERISKDKNYIFNRINAARAPEDVKEVINQNPGSMSAALEVAKLPTVEERAPLIEAVKQGATFKQVREEVRKKEAPARNLSLRRDKLDQPDESKVTDAKEKAHQVVRADMATMKSILNRWDTIMLESDPITNRMMRDVLKMVASDVERLLGKTERE